jgi:hypothetical protein
MSARSYKVSLKKSVLTRYHNLDLACLTSHMFQAVTTTKPTNKTTPAIPKAILCPEIPFASLARIVAMRERTLSLRGGMFFRTRRALSMAILLLLCFARIAVFLRQFSGFKALLFLE